MTSGRRPHPALLTAGAGFVAASGLFGMLGLMTGFLAMGETVTSRLPFQSPVVGGIALGAVVALPATLVCVLSHRRHPRAREAAAVSGYLLVGWIAVELAVIREFSPLQVVYGLAGVALVLRGDRTVAARAAAAGRNRWRHLSVGGGTRPGSSRHAG